MVCTYWVICNQRFGTLRGNMLRYAFAVAAYLAWRLKNRFQNEYGVVAPPCRTVVLSASGRLALLILKPVLS
jgi:hypothetical protein